MRAVIQRVSEASVSINGGLPRTTGAGLLILLAVARGDSPEDVSWLLRKITSMRIFEDREGKMNHSITDIEGDILIVSQFTLMASTKKGNRPSFDPAAVPEEAIPLYESFVTGVRQQHSGQVETGEFGATMKVALINEGPVTIIIDSRIRE